MNTSTTLEIVFITLGILGCLTLPYLGDIMAYSDGLWLGAITGKATNAILPRSNRSVTWANIPVSPLGLGLSRIASFSSGITERQARQLLKSALDHGINCFDTADMYGQGDSEKFLGAALQRQRDKIVICTKVGYCLSYKMKLAALVKPIIKPILGAVRSNSETGHNASSPHSKKLPQNFSPAYITAAIERSLKRLCTDYIDLLLLHNPPVDLDAALLDEIHNALEIAKREGKIRAYGVSCLKSPDANRWI